MAKMGSFDISEFIKLRDNLNKMSDPKALEQFRRECVAEIAMDVLKRTIKITPTADTIRMDVALKDENGDNVRYKKGAKKGKIKTKKEVIHTGGTLKRGWIAKTQADAEEKKKEKPTAEEITDYAYKLRISRSGDTYIAWIINPIEYASYVEYRT